MMTGTAVNGAVSAGTLAILVDLSSNYASVILGFCNLIGGAAGFLSPLVVGILTNDNVSLQFSEFWKIISFKAFLKIERLEVFINKKLLPKTGTFFLANDKRMADSFYNLINITHHKWNYFHAFWNFRRTVLE